MTSPWDNNTTPWVSDPQSLGMSSLDSRTVYAPAFAASDGRSYSSADLGRMVGSRLRYPPGCAPFKHCYFHKVDDEKVVALIIGPDGRAIVLEDGWPLFPSDEFITKLRLLEK